VIDVFSIMWNEEFMLPYFLEHYSKYADRIFIYNDHSTDRTVEIALAHPKVTLLDYPYDSFKEDEFSRTLEDGYTSYSQDSSWAICVDGDELIHGLETLDSEPTGVVLKTTGYMMIGETGKLEDCKKIRTKSFDKPVVFDPTLDVRFGDGRHTVNLPTKDSQLELWHYKYPSKEHYLERNEIAYSRIMSDKDKAYRIKKGLDWFEKHV
jgi:hypothetical protein